MGLFQQWATTHSRILKVATALFLAILIALSYLLIVILFIRPQSLLLDSLLYPSANTTNSPRLTPTVSVALLSAILTGATVALVTRCVDESLWRDLTPSNNQARLTVAEARHLAQWSISAAARFRYLGLGNSWLLKFSGLFILAFAAVNPVLLKGISQQATSSTITTYQPREEGVGPWAGFLDASNSQRFGGNTRDLLGESAFLTSLNALNPPAVPICADERCRVNVRRAGFQAKCSSTAYSNPDQMGTQNARSNSRETFCSSLYGKVCATLVRSDPATSVNFTTRLPEKPDVDGAYTVVFGTFVKDYRNVNSDYTVYTVDCDVRYGWVNITQNGTNPPVLLRDSFRTVPATELSLNATSYLQWPYRYDTNQSAWTFVGGYAGASTERLFTYAVGTALIGPEAKYSGEEVARRFETAWDTNNIFAFSRRVNATDRLTTVETPRNVYVYDRRVLFILLVPFLAMVLGIWGRWYVQGDDMMLGYDPVKIARCGPVYGVAPYLDERSIDGLMIGRYAQVAMDESGREVRYYQFLASGAHSASEESIGPQEPKYSGQ
jgi:hypothetical protein